MAGVSEEFRDAMSSWVELKTQLSEARKDIAILNKREKQLRSFIKSFMKDQEIDVIKVNKSKVSYKTTHSKGTITREVIKRGLLTFFSDDEVRAEGAYQAILDAAPNVERETLSLKV